MNRLLPVSLLAFQAAVLPAQSWWSGPERGGCFGGRECARQGYLEIRLESAPVLAVRFFAHDDVGGRTDGRLRVRIDDRVLERDMPVERAGRSYLLDGGRHRGRFLIFEALTDDEIVVDDVEIEYAERRGSASGPDRDDVEADWQDGGGGWSRYRMRDTCIGGARCSERRLEIRLLDEPIRAVRLFAPRRCRKSPQGTSAGDPGSRRAGLQARHREARANPLSRGFGAVRAVPGDRAGQ